MNSLILGMLAETSVHPGAGRSTGFVDLPVAREAATDYPVIVGSSFKGALRDHAAAILQRQALDQIFGERDSAGQVLVSDVRLLLLPVRSLTGRYRWLTCPHLIERFRRDMSRAGLADGALEVPRVDEGHCALGGGGGKLFLEERQFELTGLVSGSVLKAVEGLIENPDVRKRLETQLVVVSDDDFAWFARYGLCVNARNQLDKEKKTSENLWYEETLPSDTLMYALIAERVTGALDELIKTLGEPDWLQVGGNETVGQGWFAVHRVGGGS